MIERLLIIGLQALIGFVLFSYGALIGSSSTPSEFHIIGIIVFILGIASFVAIPTLLLSIEKGRKFILIVSAIQAVMFLIILPVFKIPHWGEIMPWMGLVIATIVILGSSSIQRILSRQR